ASSPSTMRRRIESAMISAALGMRTALGSRTVAGAAGGATVEVFAERRLVTIACLWMKELARAAAPVVHIILIIVLFWPRNRWRSTDIARYRGERHHHESGFAYADRATSQHRGRDAHRPGRRGRGRAGQRIGTVSYGCVRARWPSAVRSADPH